MKRIRWGLFLCILLLLTAGCAKKAPSAVSDSTAEAEGFAEPLYDWGKSTGETLVIWGIYPDMERSYIQTALERYRLLTGGGVEVVQIPQEEFEAQILSANAGELDMPDIIFSYGGVNVDMFDPDENFYDFSDAVWVDDLTDVSVNQTIYHGKIIGLPHWEASVSGTIYNKEIFKKYHLEIPGNQEEFLEVCRTLKDQGITPMYLPGKEISMLLYQFPLDAVVEDDSVLLGLNNARMGYQDLPELLKAVEWYRLMAQNGYFGNNWQTDDWSGMSDAMESGEYAMMLCWDTWLYTDFKGDPSGFGLMPAFVGIPQEGTFEGPNLGLFIVNKKSERLETALNFITFLADPYNYNVAFEGIYTAPVFKNQTASISTPQYLEAERLIEKKYRDSIAWLRIRGFSQMDASCILEYMASDDGETAADCLVEMEALRQERISQNEN